MNVANRNLRATGFQVLVKPKAPETQTATGILIPVEFRQPNNEGIVLSVGGRVDTHDGLLTYGARVCFSWIDRRVVQQDGQELWLLDSRQLLGVIQ